MLCMPIALPGVRGSEFGPQWYQGQPPNRLLYNE